MFDLKEFVKGKCISGVYFISESPIKFFKAQAVSSDFHLMHLQGLPITNQYDFHSQLRHISQCPWQGFTWDGTLDCIRDLSWISASLKIIVFDNIDQFAHFDGEGFTIAIRVLADATEHWRVRKADKPFYTLLSGDNALVADIRKYVPNLISLY